MKGASKRKLTTTSDLPQSVQNDIDDQADYENRNQNADENEDENGAEIVVPQLAEGFYEIEAVRKRRVRKGVTQYLIKWRGWPESSNTWEPIENLSSCIDVIEAFEDSLKPGGNRSNRRRKRNTAVTSTSQSKKHQKQPPPLENSQNQQPQDDSQNQQACEDSQNQQPHEDSEKQEQQEDSGEQEQQEVPHSPDAASYPIPSVKLRVIEEPCRGPCVHGSNTTDVAENDFGGTSQNGSAKRSNNTGSFTGSSQIGEEEGNKTEFAIHIREDIPDERVSPENGISNVDDGTQVLRSSPRIGSRRRKAFAVKRFKKDAAPKKDVTGKMTAASDAIVLDDTKNDLDSENFVDTPQSLPVITKIVKPVNYATSMINGTEEVCVSFLVMRSDGEEVVVNNEYLKENNPVLLINFYEQHLRYNNPSE